MPIRMLTLRDCQRIPISPVPDAAVVAAPLEAVFRTAALPASITVARCVNRPSSTGDTLLLPVVRRHTGGASFK